VEQATLDPAGQAAGRGAIGPRDRIATLSEALSPARRAPITALLDRADPPAAGDPAWQALVDALSHDFLADFDVTKAHLQEMVRRRMADREMLQAAGRIYQTLRRQPLDRYRDLGDALRQCGIEATAHDFAGQFLFQLMLSELNRRQQLLYQSYLAVHPFPAAADEGARLAHLQPLEALAHRLIAGAEPARLLDWLGIPSDRAGLDGFAMALNKYFFDPYRINFRFTYHCNIQCAHCYNFSGPDMKGKRIDTEAMLRVVRDMPETGMRNMNLTGGEPFMYLDTVLALVGEARKVGVPIVSTYTNGFFARTEENAHKVLGKLKEAGFMNGLGRAEDHIKVSAGVFHQEFLPFGIIINLIRVYREVFAKNIVIDYEVLEDNPDGQKAIEAELRDKGVRDLVDIRFRGVAPIGRGAQFEAELKHEPVDAFHACSFIDEIVFDPDGSVRPCCGMNFDNEGIVVGNVHENGLKNLLIGLENNAILQFIGANPIGRIFDHLDKEPAEQGYANICNLCGDAVGAMTDAQDLKRRLAAYQDYFPFWFTGERLAATV
jgi:organic radical activating enzyme